jgi:arylsulfatase A-like enzyme
MLHEDRGQTHFLKHLRDAGYFVWWGGKNDLVPGNEGPAAHCDTYFKADDAFFARHHSTPQPDLHQSSPAWRDAPGTDGYYSFYDGELRKPAGDRYYMDKDWQAVLGAIDFIGSAPKDRPLCIYLPLIYPHPPYGVESEFFAQFADSEQLPPRRRPDEGIAGKSRMLAELRQRQGLTNWHENRWDALRRVYYAMVARVDRQFGMIVAALKKADLYDDTAIFAFSDHGDYAGDYDVVEKSQNSFEDPLVRVPLVVKPPRGTAVTPGVRSQTLTELVDVSATIYALTGIDPGYDSFGRSLLPVIAYPGAPHRDVAFCEGGRRPDEVQVSERESLERFGERAPESLYYPKLSIQVNDPAAHCRAVMIRSLAFKYIRRAGQPDEFYDLAEDPQELDNRASDPRYAREIARLKDRLLTWYLDTSDIVPRQTDPR